jgi:hypothetical protein
MPVFLFVGFGGENRVTTDDTDFGTDDHRESLSRGVR